ncbi:MAG: NFACT family protein [Candidatus Woesearchaeota archaeon]|jgi:predicted ribosome quality control (RQC) complex YloA/Tae2 family protein|nr:NFACT family protein [Candidatus Woesearchaeota archaeon]
MSMQLSSLDIHFLLKELKHLENSRVDQIYNNGKEEIYIQFHKRNVGRKILRIVVGKAIFLAEAKNVDETPSGFCMLLRKHLEGKFLETIKQLESERILKLVFKSKDEIKKLYLEFFGKGNTILCNNEDVIIDCSIKHKFKDRSILPKEKYKYPNMEYNLFSIKKDQLTDLLKNSKKDKIITSIATGLGLGGVYSEEVCLSSGINKNTIPKKINDNEIKKIINSIKKIIKEKIKPQIIYENREARDAVPVDLGFYNGNEKKKFSSYSEALEEYFTYELKLSKKKDSSHEKKINEVKWIMGEQEATLKGLKVKETENRKKAELIYKNYQLIKEILDEINKASKKYSWEDIKKKLKGHKVVKDVDVKDKQVVVDMD